MADVTYTVLDAPTRTAIVQTRLRELESQYFGLSLKKTAPSPGDTFTEQDAANLAALKASIDALHGVLDGINPPAPAA